jgi:hypothetical protein
LLIFLSLGLLLASSLAAARASGVTPTSEWADVYSKHASFAGVPLPVGSYVAAYDAQGTQCGERTTVTLGYVSPMMPCYGDDSFTPFDEGAVEGDLLTFSVNGTLAAATAVQLNFKPVAPGTPVRWYSRDAWEIKLVVPPQPVLRITAGTTASQLSWQPAQANVQQYEVWRADRSYFDPVEDQAEMLGTLPASAPTLSWTDGAGAGDPSLNVAYRVVSRNSSSQMVGVSQLVGEFDYALTGP